MPGLILLEAVVACARGRSSWVEVCVLIEGHLEAGVRVAENIAASAAVVTAVEVVKIPLADGFVAHSGLGVGLVFRVSD